ncbi:MAG: PorT family protein [Flavobacteriaceae bacterium]|nr:PorT family protein [Flavobacteriaceae bacterium]MBT6447917.1 PorT family protein [Flavobacteriaceae bacterium]MDG1830521.1 porin family protein [Flavobacteriaceae bacterium]
MLRLVNLICVLLFSILCYSQINEVDDKYREDQIYFGVFYNSLINSPTDFNQNKFSSSINLGFIRDIPLNKSRNFGLGLGLGYSNSSFHNNLKFSNANNQLDSKIVSNLDSFTKNKWVLNELELPFEIRWRTSTPENYKFWRIYFGLKTSYIISSKVKYESPSNNQTIRDLPFNNFQSGFTLNAGNNTWNLGVYLGLKPLFDEEFAKNHINIKNIKQFKVGLIFYIL